MVESPGDVATAPSRCLKINVDGAYRGGGCPAVARDRRGNFVGALVAPMREAISVGAC